MAEKYVIRGEAERVYEIERENGLVRVRREGEAEWQHVELQRIGGSQLYLLMLEDHPLELYLERKRGGANATVGRHTFEYDVERWRPGGGSKLRQAEEAGVKRITAPMTGSIIEVRCAPGDTVKQGDVLLLIESMKMNNELRSPTSGTVEQVPVGVGERVNAGQLLVSIHQANG
jgi:biotin carboxyl carrier protein